MAARSGVVGVVVALPAEARCLVNRRVPFGHAVAVSPQMRICLGGIGARSAEASCQVLLSTGATALVSWGVAAGLDPSLSAGTLVVAWQIANSEGALATPQVAARASQAWADRVASRLAGRARVARGSVVSADHMLRTVADKRVAAETGAAAADMETAAVAAIAQSAAVPWIALRAIADTAHVTLPPSVLRAIDQTGRVRVGHLVRALVQRPEDVLQLPALARGFRAALRVLRTAAGEAGPALLAPDLPDDERAPRSAGHGAIA